MKVRMLGIYCRTSREESTSGIKTIVQQKELGVKFAKDNGWDYEVYEDAGKSGFKYEDEENPFKERKAFQKLLNDIADKKVTDVWVWENSRLSREHYAQALVYRIFEQNNVILWENGRKYDLHQPTDKLTKTILDAVAEYERQEIILRTSRGQRASFNSGKNRHGSMYGYVTDRNTRITSPVPEELETVVNRLELVEECMVFGIPEKDDPNDFDLAVKAVYNKETIKEKYKDKTEEELKQILWEQIKETNLTFPKYKHIKKLYVTYDELIKTTTKKVKRPEEMKLINKMLEEESKK